MADKNNQRYFTLLTDKGKYKIAAAAANKGQVVFTSFAIGDGNGAETNPLPSDTGLMNEVWRGQLDSVVTDPKNPAAIIINAIIPHNVGGWWMREFGLFDVDGDMLAVVKPAPYYKATSAEGQLEDVYYEFQLVIGEQAQVVVLVDPSILWATREYVETRRISAGQMMNKPWLPCKALDVATPPSSNNQGDTYVIPQGANGDWKDKSGQLAEWNGKAWTFVETPDGHSVGLPDGQVYQKVNGRYVRQIALSAQSGRWTLARDIGTENAIKCNLDPEPAKLDDGLLLVLVPANDATSSSITIALNNFSPKKLLNPDGTPLPPKAITKNVPAIIVYNKKIDAFSIFTSEKQGGSTISFSARGISAMTLADRVSYPIIVGTAEVSDNTGGGYNLKTGEFTVPEDGLYIVTGNAPFPYSSGGRTFSALITIEKNGVAIAENSTYTSGRVLCVAVICRMKKGDVIRLVQKAEGVNVYVDANQLAANFSAARLGK
ncbi:phage tail protein [Bartonella sp. M0280]|uniref:phage tail-collar fiber domain-containing protein n=1 Tax=Bartonella apihabitans TaxID=2750929 RepID=UPI0018DD5977|nr:phage tail protein [Bartonella apihabitans]MBI0166491.1 phage tail protein [Bartonella apihabitans]